MNRFVLFAILVISVVGCDTTKGFLTPSSTDKTAEAPELRPPSGHPWWQIRLIVTMPKTRRKP